jgi:hypothetical protein
MMSLTIYVDESGNTGDVFVKKRRIFSLIANPTLYWLQSEYLID